MLVIGAGVVEAAVFESLAARGISVALTSPRDFGAHPNQDVPTLLNDGLDTTGKSAAVDVHLINSAINRLVESGNRNIEKTPFLSIINSSDKDSLAKTSRRIVTNTMVARADKPNLVRAEPLRDKEPALRTNAVRGAISYTTVHCPEGAGRMAINYLHDAWGHEANAAVAVNYMRVIHAYKKGDKGWEIELKDSFTGKCISLLAKVVVDSAGSEVAAFPELSLHVQPTKVLRNINVTLPSLVSNKRFIRIVNSKSKRLVISPVKGRSIVTSTELCEGSATHFNQVDPQEISNILRDINQHLKLERDLSTDDVKHAWTTYSLRNPRNSKDTSIDSLPLFRPKEQIQIDANQRVINLIGARLATTTYLCDQVCKAVERMGIVFKTKPSSLESAKEHRYFLQLAHRAELFKDYPQMAEILWRRHRRASFKLLDTLESNPALAKPMVGGFDYIWAELATIRATEMVTCLDDFLLRRTLLGRLAGDKLFEIMSEEDLKKALKLGPAQTPEPNSKQ